MLVILITVTLSDCPQDSRWSWHEGDMMTQCNREVVGGGAPSMHSCSTAQDYVSWVSEASLSTGIIILTYDHGRL